MSTTKRAGSCRLPPAVSNWWPSNATWLSLVMPKASAAAANAASDGSMCGRPELVSAIMSTSKNCAPLMRSS